MKYGKLVNGEIEYAPAGQPPPAGYKRVVEPGGPRRSKLAPGYVYVASGWRDAGEYIRPTYRLQRAQEP